MFTIKPRSENDIQGGETPRFWYFEFIRDDQIIFSTEDLEPLFALQRLPDGGTITLQADRNSAELGTFYELKITRKGQALEFMIRGAERPTFYDIGTVPP